MKAYKTSRVVGSESKSMGLTFGKSDPYYIKSASIINTGYKRVPLKVKLKEHVPF